MKITGGCFALLAATLLAATAAGPTVAQGRVQTKTYANGAVYEGRFLDGRQHGTGRYTQPDGYEYEGDWVEGRIEGRRPRALRQRRGL